MSHIIIQRNSTVAIDSQMISCYLTIFTDIHTRTVGQSNGV